MIDQAEELFSTKTASTFYRQPAPIRKARFSGRFAPAKCARSSCAYAGCTQISPAAAKRICPEPPAGPRKKSGDKLWMDTLY